ncbi:hypothetical protein H8959_008300, partial [Pygathrix nigripes]
MATRANLGKLLWQSGQNGEKDAGMKSKARGSVGATAMKEDERRNKEIGRRRKEEEEGGRRKEEEGGERTKDEEEGRRKKKQQQQQLPPAKENKGAKWECPARKVSTARSDLGLRTGRLCYPGGVAPSLQQLQGGTAARHPILLRLWHQPRHVSAQASHAPRLIQQAHSPRPRAHGYLGGRHDSPWLPVTAGPTHWLTGVRGPGGSLPVLAAAAAAARAAIRPGS